MNKLLLVVGIFLIAIVLSVSCVGNIPTNIKGTVINIQKSPGAGYLIELDDGRILTTPNTYWQPNNIQDVERGKEYYFLIKNGVVVGITPIRNYPRTER